jgi:hypothetical protein
MGEWFQQVQRAITNVSVPNTALDQPRLISVPVSPHDNDREKDYAPSFSSSTVGGNRPLLTNSVSGNGIDNKSTSTHGAFNIPASINDTETKYGLGVQCP